MKRMNLKTVFFVALVIMGMTFYGCQDEYENISTYGKLKVELTDAPFPTDLVAEANVTIDKIEIRQMGETEESPFITLSEEVQSFNLLDLTNGVTASLVDMEIETGSYDLIRMHVSEASIKLSDGTEYDLFIPSGAQSGIKIFIDPSIEVSGGLTTELLLDFDVSKSFVLKGNMDSPAGIKGFNFKPVILASNNTTSGTLQGVVTNAADETLIEGAQVAIWAADTVYKTSFTDETGAYAVLGIEAGTYSVEYAKEGFETVVTEEVVVSAGNATTNDVALAAVEATSETTTEE